jgi:hypothetical protein
MFTNLGRAETPEEKQAVCNRLCTAWCASPSERLGQFIENRVDLTRLFYLEDQKLIAQLEAKI